VCVCVCMCFCTCICQASSAAICWCVVDMFNNCILHNLPYLPSVMCRVDHFLSQPLSLSVTSLFFHFRFKMLLFRQYFTIDWLPSPAAAVGPYRFLTLLSFYASTHATDVENFGTPYLMNGLNYRNYPKVKVVVRSISMSRTLQGQIFEWIVVADRGIYVDSWASKYYLVWFFRRYLCL